MTVTHVAGSKRADSMSQFNLLLHGKDEPVVFKVHAKVRGRLNLESLSESVFLGSDAADRVRQFRVSTRFGNSADELSVDSDSEWLDASIPSIGGHRYLRLRLRPDQLPVGRHATMVSLQDGEGNHVSQAVYATRQADLRVVPQSAMIDLKSRKPSRHLLLIADKIRSTFDPARDLQIDYDRELLSVEFSRQGEVPVMLLQSRNNKMLSPTEVKLSLKNASSGFCQIKVWPN